MAVKSGQSGNRKMFADMVFSAIFRRRSRAVMAVVATLIGSATLSCLALIAIAVPEQMTTEMREFGANLIVTPAASTSESQSGADTLENGISAQTVEQASQMVTSQATARMATYRYENVRINSAPYVVAGIDVDEVQNLNRHWNVDGEWPSDGNVLMGRDTADMLGLEIGSSVTIGYRGDLSSSEPETVGAAPGEAGDEAGVTGAEGGVVEEAGEASSTDDDAGAIVGGHNAAQTAPEGAHGSTDILDTEGLTYRVGGIVDTGGSEDQIIYMVKADVEKLTGTERGVDVVEFSSEASAEILPTIAKTINDDADLDVKAEQVTKMTSSDTRIIAMLQTLFWIVSLVVLGLTLVGVGTTISSIVSQRRNEIGLRKALGASERAVGAEFLSESALFGLFGGVIGALVGYGLARLLCTQVFGRTLDFSWLLAVVTIVLSMLVAVAASMPPVRRATRIDPAIVLSEE